MSIIEFCIIKYNQVNFSFSKYDQHPRNNLGDITMGITPIQLKYFKVFATLNLRNH